MSSAEVARKAWHGRQAAENMQPWRCVGCGVAVHPGKNDPCKCFDVAAAIVAFFTAGGAS